MHFICIFIFISLQSYNVIVAASWEPLICFNEKHFFLQLNQSAKEEAKTIDLNKVVLRFQAFFLNPEAGCYRPITEPVDSDVIFNLSKLFVL